jgi:hypothetical protein
LLQIPDTANFQPGSIRQLLPSHAGRFSQLRETTGESIYEAIRTGQLEAFRVGVGPRSIRVSREALAAFIDKKKI